MASRRENQRTDTSWTSSLVDVMEQTLRLEDRLHILESESPQARLRRLLSTKSVISTSSSYAERQQAAVGCRSPFREIGTGSIGKVFEQAGTLWAFKVLLIERSDKLWNNYIMNLRIQDSFDRIDLDTGSLELPRAAWFASKDSEFWPENLHLFPDDPTFPRRPREILCMERIFPLPQSVRDALIDLFCNPNHAAAAKSAPANKDCIVRVFIGRKRFGTSLPGGSRFFSLRNYKLHVDQISELQLDADEYATSMANALAILHWHTRIDAMDVEFVLGSTPLDLNSVRRALPLQDIARLRPGTSTFERATNTTPNFKKRVVSLWMLDFDTCGPITMNAAGVNQAVRAFIENDPYYPRPYSNDPYSERLWQIFSQRYIEKGKKVISASLQSLPQQFIHGVLARLSPPTQTIPPRPAAPTQGPGATSGSRPPAPYNQQPQQPPRSRSTQNAPRHHQGRQRGGRGSARGSSSTCPATAGNRGEEEEARRRRRGLGRGTRGGRGQG